MKKGKIKILTFLGEQEVPGFVLLVVSSDEGWVLQKVLWGHTQYKVGKAIPNDEVDGESFKLSNPSIYRKRLSRDVKRAARGLEKFNKLIQGVAGKSN